MKRVLSVAIVLVMLLALSVSVFADDTVPSINVSDTTTDSHDTDVELGGATTGATSAGNKASQTGGDDYGDYTDSPYGSYVKSPYAYVCSPAASQASLADGTETVTLADDTPATIKLDTAKALDSEQKRALKEKVAALSDDVASTLVASETVDLELVDENDQPVDAKNFPAEGVPVVFVRSTDDGREVVKVLYWDEENSEWDEATDVQQDGTKVTATFAHFCTVMFLLKEITTEEEEEPDTTTPSTPSTTNSGKNDNSPQTGYNTVIWVSVAAVMILAAGVCFVGARKKVKE